MMMTALAIVRIIDCILDLLVMMHWMTMTGSAKTPFAIAPADNTPHPALTQNVGVNFLGFDFCSKYSAQTGKKNVMKNWPWNAQVRFSP